MNAGAGVSATASTTSAASAENRIEAFLSDLLKSAVHQHCGTFKFTERGLELGHIFIILLPVTDRATAAGRTPCHSQLPQTAVTSYALMLNVR